MASCIGDGASSSVRGLGSEAAAAKASGMCPKSLGDNCPRRKLPRGPASTPWVWDLPWCCCWASCRHHPGSSPPAWLCALDPPSWQGLEPHPPHLWTAGGEGGQWVVASLLLKPLQRQGLWRRKPPLPLIGTPAHHQLKQDRGSTLGRPGLDLGCQDGHKIQSCGVSGSDLHT